MINDPRATNLKLGLLTSAVLYSASAAYAQDESSVFSLEQDRWSLGLGRYVGQDDLRLGDYISVSHVVIPEAISPYVFGDIGLSMHAHRGSRFDVSAMRRFYPSGIENSGFFYGVGASFGYANQHGKINPNGYLDLDLILENLLSGVGVSEELLAYVRERSGSDAGGLLLDLSSLPTMPAVDIDGFQDSVGAFFNDARAFVTENYDDMIATPDSEIPQVDAGDVGGQRNSVFVNAMVTRAFSESQGLSRAAVLAQIDDAQRFVNQQIAIAESQLAALEDDWPDLSLGYERHYISGRLLGELGYRFTEVSGSIDRLDIAIDVSLGHGLDYLEFDDSDLWGDDLAAACHGAEYALGLSLRSTFDNHASLSARVGHRFASERDCFGYGAINVPSDTSFSIDYEIRF